MRSTTKTNTNAATTTTKTLFSGTPTANNTYINTFTLSAAIVATVALCWAAALLPLHPSLSSQPPAPPYTVSVPPLRRPEGGAAAAAATTAEYRVLARYRCTFGGCGTGDGCPRGGSLSVVDASSPEGYR